MEKHNPKPVKSFYADLHRVFLTSSAPVYIQYGEVRTYPELFEQMLRINSVLSRYQRQKIAMFAEKGFSTYGVIYSVFLSNNTWVPINPTFPERRVIEILKSAEPAVILADRPLPAQVAEFARSKGIDFISIQEVVAQRETKDFDLDSFQEEDIAYLLFTSGSTGTPKGVPIPHRSYTNFISETLKIMPFEKSEVFSDYNDYGFDISIFPLFSAIATGGALAPALDSADQTLPLKNIVENRVTVYTVVPSAVSRLRTALRGRAFNNSVRQMFLSGEMFRIDHLEYCFNGIGAKEIFNFYGLTETGVENLFYRCKPDDLFNLADLGQVPIGRPFPGNSAQIDGRGELLLSGCQITPGYLGGVSADKFTTIGGIRWFRTGDQAEQRGDVFVCKGRFDSQVKWRGYRIELMDIEANIRKFPGIEDVVCFLAPHGDRENLFAALVAPKISAYSALREYLLRSIPAYMVPGGAFRMDALPINKSGKIDRPGILKMFLEGVIDLLPE